MHRQTMFDRVGGLVPIKTLVEKFYARAESDPTLAHYFAGVRGDRREELHRHFAIVVVSILGGPRSDQYVMDLQVSHRYLEISRDDYWRTVAHLIAAMDELGLCELAPDIVKYVFAVAVDVESQVVAPRGVPA